jgi:hypothetical protein
VFFEGARSSFVLNPLDEVRTTARSQPGPAGMPVQAAALHSGWRFCLHLQGRSRPHTKASLPILGRKVDTREGALAFGFTDEGLCCKLGRPGSYADKILPRNFERSRSALSEDSVLERKS